MNARKSYLINEVPKLLTSLHADHEPVFGVMTAQHMVEHLIWVTKSSLKDFGPAPENLSEGQLKFMKFVKKGAHLRHRAEKSSMENLADLRMNNLEEAISEIPRAIDRLYSAGESKAFFNPMMGLLTFEEMELFHYKHFKYHLQHQFGLGIYP